MDKLKEYSIVLLTTVITQIIGVLGIFFAFGYILSKLQDWTQKQYFRSTGWKGILWTAWIGTPVHELGHAFFAKIFRHKIEQINLFRPDQSTGRLGHVDHSYDRKSTYQKIGNFFIGAAPMIFGSLIMVFLLFWLVPNGKEVFAPLKSDFSGFLDILYSVKASLVNLFTPENLSSWKFWLFVYLSFCISSHIAPSRKDRQGMWNGFIWLVILLLLVNGITLLVGVDITKYVLKVNQYLGIFVAIFTYATVISIFHLLVSYFMLFPFRKRR